MKSFAAALALLVPFIASAADDEAATLRAHLQANYPSLAYVERYRAAYPAEVQGSDALWTTAALPTVVNASQLVMSLVGLQDQHVGLGGSAAGQTETLGVLFRTSSDGQMIAWRVFDSIAAAIKPGDTILAIDKVATKDWLEQVQKVTFGGNRRSRSAEAALHFGMATRVVHQMQGIGETVMLTVQSKGEKARTVSLRYEPMSEQRAAAVSEAVNRRDLPVLFSASGVRVGTMRLGAFAPQYDPLYNKVAELAEKEPGATEDSAMLDGFCAIVGRFVNEYDVIATQADVMVLDLRGNMGGFGREARLLSAAMTRIAPPPTFDVFASGKAGVVKLVAQPEDEVCMHVSQQKPLIVLTDAGTRSSGELMSAWMWASGAIIAGERTIGAGGGYEFGSSGFKLEKSGFNVRTSGNFTFFDQSGQLKGGEADEQALLNTVASDAFAPSHLRPFAIQSAGMAPDIASASTLGDLHDGGVAQVARVIAALQRQAVLKN